MTPSFEFVPDRLRTRPLAGDTLAGTRAKRENRSLLPRPGSSIAGAGKKAIRLRAARCGRAGAIRFRQFIMTSLRRR